MKKGDNLGEYIGHLTPIDLDRDQSLYRFEIPGVCAIDAQSCGNWTRFVNSACGSRANVSAWTDTVGKRHIVFYQASKDIGPEEELLVNYGNLYFKKAGFKCDCGALKRPHMPAEVRTKVGKGTKAKKAKQK